MYILNLCTVLLFISISTMFAMCTSEKKASTFNSDFKRVDLHYKIPTIKEKGVIWDLRDSISIYYYKDIVMYGFPILYEIEEENETFYQERRLKCFLFQKNQKVGYLFNKVDDTTFKKMDVDSFLAINAFKGVLFDKQNERLVETVNLKDGKIEKYISIKKPDYSYADTTIFYYTSKNSFYDFSFSNELEKSSNMKIFKVKAVYNKSHLDQYNLDLPYREFVWKVNKSKSLGFEDLESLIQFFETSVLKR